MCDADVDGSHIRTFITDILLQAYEGRLLKQEGYISAQPPLYKIKIKKKNIMLMIEDEKDQILKGLS